MSQTSAAGHSPASHTAAPTQQAQGAQHGAKQRQGAEAGGDLFSSLLALLASTNLPADENATSLTDTTDAARTDTPQDNPLAGLLATLPGWMPAGMKAATPGAGGADTADRAVQRAVPTPPGKTDGATPLTAEARAMLQPLEPGAARERGLEARVERSLNQDKARPALGATSFATQASHIGTNGTNGTNGQPGRGAEPAPGLTWVRAGGASETAAQALASSRPTVALDERFAGTPAPSWSAVAQREAGLADELGPGEALGLRSGAAAGSGEGTGSIGAAGAGSATAGDGSLGGDAGQGGSASGSDTPRDDSNPPWAAAAEDTEVTHWGAGHVRHASLRVGGEGDDAIDIRLQMQGQELQVGFATDDAQTRELLREQAPQVLGELLQRSGVELGGVSVGAQGQPGQHTGSGTPAERSAGLERTGRSGRTEAAAAPALQPLQPKTDGNRPLDVFA